MGQPALPEENYGLHEHTGFRNRHGKAAQRIGGEIRLDSPSVVKKVDEFTTYLGFAKNGTLTTAAEGWTIIRVTNADSGNTIHIMQAELGADDLIFDDYINYDYTY